MRIRIINPVNGLPLEPQGDRLVDPLGNSYPVIAGVPRICSIENYTGSFGKQWNAFRLTQIDRHAGGQALSEERFFATTSWKPAELDGLDVLEVGSGAGRFTRVVLERTRANLWSVDYSTAVEANFATNAALGGGRLHLYQASIYEMPFPDASFDRVFCMGVLQHTPDFEASVRALVCKAKPGGEIVVDFYTIRGFWTKIHAKYLLRPITRRMSHERLLGLIERNAGRLIATSRFLNRVGLHVLTRFLPVCDIRILSRSGLTEDQLREWAVLDTFDMFSPRYDQPKTIAQVADMFRRSGATVTFAQSVPIAGSTSAIVRAVRDADP